MRGQITKNTSWTHLSSIPVVPGEVCTLKRLGPIAPLTAAKNLSFIKCRHKIGLQIVLQSLGHCCAHQSHQRAIRVVYIQGTAELLQSQDLVPSRTHPPISSTTAIGTCKKDMVLSRTAPTYKLSSLKIISWNTLVKKEHNKHDGEVHPCCVP